MRQAGEIRRQHGHSMRLGTAVAKFGRCRRLRVVVTLFTSLCLSPYSLCLYLHLFLSLVPIATAVQAGPRPASLRARVSKPFEFEARSTAPNTPPFISRATGATSLSPPPLLYPPSCALRFVAPLPLRHCETKSLLPYIFSLTAFSSPFTTSSNLLPPQPLGSFPFP